VIHRAPCGDRLLTYLHETGLPGPVLVGLEMPYLVANPANSARVCALFKWCCQVVESRLTVSPLRGMRTKSRPLLRRPRARCRKPGDEPRDIHLRIGDDGEAENDCGCGCELKENVARGERS
jgi:hypothetical protein